jgi:ribonuclease BN (tRNA processing enzyme)
MQLTVIGGVGGWPSPGGACSGYLLQHEGFNLLIDPGYAVVPALLRRLPAENIDAVLVSHGHPDHCADINPLLRIRAFSAEEPPALPLYALPNALDAVLALDRPSMLGGSYRLELFETGDVLTIGPFEIETLRLPHPRPNAGFRISTQDVALAYTGDCGPSPDLVELARSAQVLLAEASFSDTVPDDLLGSLSSAVDVGREAAQAAVDRLVLTHLLPGQNADRAIDGARTSFAGLTQVAQAGLSIPLTG